MSAVSLGTCANAKVVMPNAARETHMHVVGMSGAGKSYFLEHLIRQDITNGAGVCVIDPHGELYDNLVAWLAEQQMDRYRTIHLLNLADEHWTVGFNPLCAGDADPTVRVGAMVNACMKVWGSEDASQTPRLAKCLRAVFYALAHHRLSLLEAKQLTSYATADVRERLTSKLPSADFLDEWREFNAYPQREFITYFESTNSRLLPIVTSNVVRRMVGQTENVIDFFKCMNQRHIVLVNLATRDRAEEQDAQLIGAMLFADLFAAAKRRNVRDGEHTPFYCYVDECADYITPDIARMLDQTRKFGLHLILAHQRLEQLKRYGENLYNAVMAGAQSKVVFKVDDDDTAEVLARFLYRKELDLEEPKRILDKPVAVGQVPIWLHSESRSTATTETHSETTSHVVSEGVGEVASESLQADDEGTAYGTVTTGGSTTTSAEAFGTAAGHSVGVTHSETTGRSQSLATQYQVLPTSVYSLEEQIHKAIVAVRSLPKRTALAYLVDGGKPFRFSTLTVRPGAVLPSQVAHFCERTHEKSAFTAPVAAVTQQIEARRTETIKGVPLTDDDDAFWVGQERVVD